MTQFSMAVVMEGIYFVIYGNIFYCNIWCVIYLLTAIELQLDGSSTVQCSIVYNGTVQYNAVELITVQYNTLQ